MADIFIIAIAFYVLYKLIFEFVVPVYKTTTQVKNQFRNGHDNRQQHANNSRQQQKAEPQKQRTDTLGEYIDFEEVKKP
jgi:hypothetical protein